MCWIMKSLVAMAKKRAVLAATSLPVVVVRQLSILSYYARLTASVSI